MASLSSGSTFSELAADDPNFVHLDERYKCCVCKRVLRNPMQTRCGHRLCEKCVPEIFARGEPVTCPAADEDCEPLKKTDIFPDKSARREIRNLLVYCKNSGVGCDFTAAWKDIEKHEAGCHFTPVECPNKQYGCNTLLIQSLMSNHEKECEFRQTKCRRCGQSFPVSMTRQHDDNECPETLISCRYNCGTQQMKRRELPDHFLVCPRKPQECKFKSIGCTFTGSADELADHESRGVSSHLELITVYTGSMDLQSMDIRQKLQELTSERDDLMKQLTESRKDNESLKTSIHKLEKTVKDFRLKMVGHTERLIVLERKFEELPRKEKFEEFSRDLASMKEKSDRLQEQIRSMDGSVVITRFGNLNTMADALTTQLSAHDRQIGIHDVRIAEMDLRFQILETVNYEGTLIWKIKDYTRRKQEAMTGRTLSLYSQPFYTSRYGYKLCARVYLNGDGMGKTTHISLFFVLMRGEYDALMPWPFQYKVTLFLLDQTDSKSDLSDHFHPDPNSSSFKRPTTEMNIASGCPLFASHAVIESRNSKYLKEDTIYIKVVVENTTTAVVQ